MISPVFELEKLEFVLGPWSALVPVKPVFKVIARRIFKSEWSAEVGVEVKERKAMVFSVRR